MTSGTVHARNTCAVNRYQVLFHQYPEKRHTYMCIHVLYFTCYLYMGRRYSHSQYYWLLVSFHTFQLENKII